MTSLFPFLLQISTAGLDVVTEQSASGADESYLSLVLKGGWILLPIFLLSLLSIYVIINKYLQLNSIKVKDTVWVSHISDLITEGKIDKALNVCISKLNTISEVLAAGLKEADKSIEEIEEAMEIEARQQVSILENKMNWLEITSSIAPMLGFLGTIFGVIKIFYDIASTNDLAIDTISTGLYQKMICSGAGLLVGIIAYSGYNLLNSRIDKAVVSIEKNSNEVIKALRVYKKQQVTSQSEEI